MKRKILLVIALMGLYSSWAEDQVRNPMLIAAGITFGPLSGAGIAGEVWMDQLGMQLSAFPLFEIRPDYHKGLLIGGMQLRYALDEGLPSRPWNYERHGYVYSRPYVYLGTMIYQEWGQSHDNAFSSGVGFAMETFWRNWRLSTGVGIAVLSIEESTFTIPSLDISLMYGI